MVSTLTKTSNPPERSTLLGSVGTWYVVVASLLLASLATLPAYLLLWPYWVDSLSYSHGMLVVPISVWLLWRQKENINAELPRPTYVAIVPLAGLLLLSTFGFAANIEIITTALLPPILLSAVLLVAGVQVTRISAFPVLLLYSAIPVWDLINGALQSATVVAVTVFLRVLNVPAYIEGTFVQIPAGLFEIEGGCSGLHFLVVGLTIAAIYAHLYMRSLRRQLALVALMAAMSILMNWIRVTAIIVAGHLTGMQSYLVKVDHYTFGWVLFLVMLVPFFVLARSMEERDDTGTSSPAEGGRSVSSSGVSAMPLLTICVLAIVPIVIYSRLLAHTPTEQSIELPSSSLLGEPLQTVGSWQPQFRGAHGEVLGSYDTSSGRVDVYANWFDGESQGRELIGYGADVTGPTLVRVYDRVYVESELEKANNSMKFREIMAETRSGERRLIHYAYIVGESSIVDPVTAKIHQAVDSMRGRFGSGLIAWSMRCDRSDTDCDSTRRKMISLGDPISAALLYAIPGGPDQREEN